MKTKRLLSILLIAAMMFSCIVAASAATADEERKANALYELNLFKGVSTMTVDFALDKSLNRAEGIVMLLRMLGVEQKALGGTWAHPFTDLAKTNSAWADKYIGYAYVNGLTKGTGAATFSGSNALTDQQFATMCLRALGYADSGDAADFQWNDSTSFAAKKGILSSGEKIAAFDRGNAVTMIWEFLNSELKNSSQTLADRLVADGVFTSSAFARASKIADGTTSSGSGSGSGGSGSSSGGSGSSSGGTDGQQTTGGTDTTEVKVPTTFEEYQKMSNSEKYRLYQFLGEDEYDALVSKLQNDRVTFEIGDDPVNLDDFG
ncbi:MAG: S-layer homology domain-containing protein [Oscillospiraceae bacterium]|nr:S-layer homology domain-containing protein [Oscillospiraceae bacterium]